VILSILDPRLYIAIAIACGLSYGTGRWQQWRADEKANAAAAFDASEQAREVERLASKTRQGIEDAKNAEIRVIRGRLDAATERLRQRPDRLPEAARPACTGATGAELSGRDAAFLERLAARADEIRTELKACQDREHGGTSEED
jgi:flagellum-specific peptidoglycan hydrolase FlgJ